ncbi:hypothetical protein [Mycobacterium sp. E735]|uniref:hypothetical protein n=1 Tax=Mycobacterium sp. E735 TaxID=1834148 RepID=UPI0012EAD24A|nr:hypothetical protein [Mycobacterium sp. E735]
MAIADKLQYDYRPILAPAVTALTIPLGLALFVLMAGAVPSAVADASGQYVRTQSGRVRCLVMANDQSEGPGVACEAGGLPADAPPEQAGFPQAPTNPASNCPPPPGTYLRCTPPMHWDLAVVHASGAFKWEDGNIGGGGTPQNDLVLNYGQTYHINGWTILPSSDGTRFTNDGTGHGMFVSIQNVYAF